MTWRLTQASTSACVETPCTFGDRDGRRSISDLPIGYAIAKSFAQRCDQRLGLYLFKNWISVPHGLQKAIDLFDKAVYLVNDVIMLPRICYALRFCFGLLDAAEALIGEAPSQLSAGTLPFDNCEIFNRVAGPGRWCRFLKL